MMSCHCILWETATLLVLSLVIIHRECSKVSVAFYHPIFNSPFFFKLGEQGYENQNRRLANGILILSRAATGPFILPLQNYKNSTTLLSILVSPVYAQFL